MIRNLKVLGLALLAVFALGAVASASASASVSIFDSPKENTILTGTSENTQVFTREPEGVKLECTHAQFVGTQTGVFNGTSFSTATVEEQAEYTTPTCSGPLGSEIHINFTTNECGYHFEGTASKTAVFKLVCKKGTGVLETPTVFGSSLCTITIPPQATGGHVVFANLAGGMVTAEFTLTEISSTKTGSSACGPESVVKGGTYTGNSVITGFEDNVGKEGAQIPIEVT